jgi:transposase
MPRTHAPYSPEFRRQMVELVRAGRDPEELSREFEPTAQSIRNWVAAEAAPQASQAKRGDGQRDEGCLSAVEREELHRLRRENRQLREEREILKKAAAWFARESESIPRKPSDS